MIITIIITIIIITTIITTIIITTIITIIITNYYCCRRACGRAGSCCTPRDIWGVPWWGSVSAHLAWGDVVTFNMSSKVQKNAEHSEATGHTYKGTPATDRWLIYNISVYTYAYIYIYIYVIYLWNEQAELSARSSLTITKSKLAPPLSCA